MSETTDPLRVEYGEQLDGLQLVRQSPPVGSASFSATYVGPAGWGFDRDGREGTARLVNQLITSAAGRFNRVELARTLDRTGAMLSHQTAPESGEVTIWGPAVEWERLLALLGDVVLRPRFDASDVARARRQIRERQLRETTQPAQRAEREFLASAFPSHHPYSRTGFGTAASIRRITRADLVRFHREHYSSADAILVVTGPARLSAMERAARRLFSHFETARPSSLAVPSLRTGRPVERTVNLAGRSQVEVRVGGPSIARSDPEYPAAALANEILGGRPLLSRLFQRVREKGGLAYHASSELEAMRFGGYWLAQAGTGADRWRRVVRMLRQEVERLGRTEVPPSELEMIRESAIGEIPLALESTAEAHELAVDVAYHRLPPDYWEKWPRALRAVRPQEVRAAAARALDGRSAVTVLAGPLHLR
jgi:zinc protease